MMAVLFRPQRELTSFFHFPISSSFSPYALASLINTLSVQIQTLSVLHKILDLSSEVSALCTIFCICPALLVLHIFWGVLISCIFPNHVYVWYHLLLLHLNASKCSLHYFVFRLFMFPAILLCPDLYSHHPAYFCSYLDSMFHFCLLFCIQFLELLHQWFVYLICVCICIWSHHLHPTAPAYTKDSALLCIPALALRVFWSNFILSAAQPWFFVEF